MSFKASWLRLTCLLVVLFWAVGAQAQSLKYPITGDMRFQIGDGLPIPITFVPPPAGGVDATKFAWISQTTGPDPKKITEGKQRIFTAPGTPMVLPLFKNAPAIFQIYTAISLNLPSPTINGISDRTFQANGRTGPPTFTWCPGLPLPAPRGTGTSNYNPGCTSPKNPSYLIPARGRFIKTANQFGGPMGGIVGGWVDLALKGSADAPCHYSVTPQCTVVFAVGPPLRTGANGGPLNHTAMTAGPAPSPGQFQVGVTDNGLITAITYEGLGPGQGNPVTSWALPWTTGQLVNTAYTLEGGTEMFTRTGYDGRVSGIGNLSMIGGAVSDRGYSGPNANRSWLTITVPEPAAVVSAAGALLLLVGCHSLVRRRSR